MTLVSIISRFIQAVLKSNSKEFLNKLILIREISNPGIPEGQENLKIILTFKKTKIKQKDEKESDSSTTNFYLYSITSIYSNREIFYHMSSMT